MIAYAGDELGFSREQMSNLDLNTLTLACRNDLCSKNELLDIWQNMIRARTEQKTLNDSVSTPPLIFSERDFIVVPSYVSKPNFVTQSSIVSETIVLKKIR